MAKIMHKLQESHFTKECMISLSFFTVDFDRSPNPVTLTSSGPGVVGNNFSLMCSARLISPVHLPTNVPSPTFEWFFGPYGNASLPSGVTPMETVMIDNTYTSTLQFSPTLNELHAGMYTCRLGEGQLVNSTVVSVDGMLSRNL